MSEKLYPPIHMTISYDRLMQLQGKYEKYLPESIRNDAEAIEYSLMGVYKDLPKLNEVQELAADIVLWTVDMFEAYEEGELDDEGDDTQ
jgi:hypothetical protein